MTSEARRGQHRLDLVAGARPNFMKLAPVWRALTAAGDVHLRFIHTGQHHDAEMDADLLTAYDLPTPDLRLPFTAEQGIARLAHMRAHYGAFLAAHPADGVVVFGDVDGTLAAAQAAQALDIPVAHVEAGLRSGDKTMPEERNRIAVDAIADLHLLTEDEARPALEAEGLDATSAVVVGNPMVDTLRAHEQKARALRAATALGLARRAYVLVTLHRAAHVDTAEALGAWVTRLHALAAHTPVVFPVHPRTQAAAEEHGLDLAAEGLHLLPPQAYEAHLSLMADAALVVTDSGGMPTECAVLGVPCASLRTNLEHATPVASGAVRLVGDDQAALQAALAEARSDNWGLVAPHPLWDGQAGSRIADALLEWLTAAS